MGEAKRRKMADLNYGRIPKQRTSSPVDDSGYPALLKDQLGVITSNPIAIEGRKVSLSPNFDPQEVRYSILFWDMIVWPRSKSFYFPSNSDENFLESAGILSRPLITIDGQAAQALPQMQIQAFLELERRDQGAWALAQGKNSLILQDQRFDEGRGFLVELHKAVPVPDKDVPLQEILEFRERRRPELLRLRAALSDIYAGILSSGDQDFEVRRRVAEIENACVDLIKVSKDWKRAVRLTDLKAAFKAQPVVYGWLVGQQFAMGQLGALVGAGVTAMKIVKDFGMAGVRDRESPYRYAASYHDELFR